MTATPPDAVNPSVWARFANEDLAAAEATITQVIFPRQSAYHAQQAAEKAIKAVLFARGIPPPFIHDIGSLAARLNDADRPPVTEIEMADLTSWAVAHRYPGIVGSVAQAEAERSFAIAARIVAWMNQLLATDPRPNESV